MTRSLLNNLITFRRKASGVRSAVLHIGTEKTGSTSLQTYLSEHRSALYERGILFPQSCGLSCHSRLVAYVKNQPDERLLRMIAVGNDSTTVARWKSRFQRRHHKEVVRFHARCAGDSTTVYSSEHFQSLVRDTSDIKRVHRLLHNYYDKVTLVVYLKRQDRMAFSAHNTAVQSGFEKRFSFDGIGPGYYYDHLRLVSNWASVFGSDNVRVRVCEKSRLYQCSVVSDLLHLAGLSEQLRALPPAPAANERLSPEALELMLKFNQIYRTHTHVGGVPLALLRQRLVNYLRSVPSDDGDGAVPACADSLVDSSAPKGPSVGAARAFYAQFEASNDELFDRYLGGDGFDPSFSEYPVSDSAQRPGVSEESLTSVINRVLEWSEVG